MASSPFPFPLPALLAQDDVTSLSRDKLAMFFDLDLLDATLRTVQAAFPPSTLHTMYPNPVRAFLSNVAAQGFGLEVASLPELVLALRLLPGERVCFDSPAKTQDELLRALEAGVAINVDNFEELERIEQLVGAQNAAKSVIGIRINPQKESGSIAMVSTATRTSKFGIGLLDYRAQLLDAYSRLRFLNALHLHVGSQGCPIPLLVDNIVAAYEFLLEANERRKAASLPPIATFDIGGGHPVDYESDALPDFASYTAQLRERLPLLWQPDCGIRLVTEFGRSISAKMGKVLTAVEYVKETGAQPIAVVHCGADLFVRPAYLPSIWKHRITLHHPDGSPKTEGPQRAYNVAGPLCFSGDLIAHQRPFASITSGDWMVVHDAGAYTLGMWSSYNSRQAPAVFGFKRHDGGVQLRLMKKRQTVEEVLAFWE